MLKRIKRAVAVAPLLITLAACNAAETTTTVQADPPATTASTPSLCPTIGKLPAVAGDATLSVVRARQTTLRDTQSWLASRNGPRGPREDLSRFSAIDSKAAAESPVELCVFGSSEPRPVPQMPGSQPINATGIRVIVQDSKHYAIHAYGEVNKLASALDAVAGQDKVVGS